MPTILSSFLESLHRYPSGAELIPGEMDKWLEPWGFTTYRTYYGPGSEQQWYRLLQNMTNAAKHELSQNCDPNDDPNTISKLEDLFSLDPRSDPETLNGLTLDEVRQVYKDKTGGKPISADLNIYSCFIVADAEVLKDNELRFIKLAESDYDPTVQIPSHSRIGPRRYFGWIRMSSLRLLSIWFELDLYCFAEICNFTSGGPGGWWTVDDDR